MMDDLEPRGPDTLCAHVKADFIPDLHFAALDQARALYGPAARLVIEGTYGITSSITPEPGKFRATVIVRCTNYAGLENSLPCGEPAGPAALADGGNADSGCCPGCFVQPGEPHRRQCESAHCPGCGWQRSDCKAECGKGDGEPAIWHGLNEQAAAARQLSWWTTAPGVDHLVEHREKVLAAQALGMITWDTATQTYIIGNVDEALVDALLTGGGQ